MKEGMGTSLILDFLGLCKHSATYLKLLSDIVLAIRHWMGMVIDLGWRSQTGGQHGWIAFLGMLRFETAF